MTENSKQLDGQVAVVTGAGSGLGARAAIAYAIHGADLVLLGRRIERLEQTANNVRALGHKALALACDVSNGQDVEAAFATAVERFGALHILLNNAGVAGFGAVDEMPVEDWLHTMDINLNGVFYCCRQALPVMRQQEYGRIVNISSINALIGAKNGARHAYSASKAAILGLTTSLAATYMQYNICVNALCPGLFETEMTKDTVFANKVTMATYNRIVPASRPGILEELDGALLLLSSPQASYITGQHIAVDGGDSVSKLL